MNLRACMICVLLCLIWQFGFADTNPFEKHLPVLAEGVVHLQYAHADEIGKLLQDKNAALLSKRGHAAVDVRTNSLWIREEASQFKNLRKLINKLDVPVKQVLIKAKIVNIDKNNQAAFGVRFGLTRSKRLSGTLKGATALANGEPVTKVPQAERLNFDLPAQFLFNRPASLGLAVAKLSNDFLLDLELSALEQEGVLEIVASPRLVATHARSAQIEAGAEIPYQEQLSGGGSSARFKKAVMSLQVTPRVISEDRILLALDIKQDKPGEKIGTGVVIETQHMQTQVLLRNNETAVIGGIQEKWREDLQIGVPILSHIPLLGRLFRYTRHVLKKKSLLIFITPTILASACGKQCI